MITEDISIIVRDMVPNDKAFILATWLRGLYYGDSWFKQIHKDIFMRTYHTALERLLARPDTVVKVACLKDDLDEIKGYSVMSPDRTTLHFVFVRKGWRGQKIAKMLVPTTVTSVTHLTGLGLSVLKKHPEMVFNPFLFQ